MEHFGTKLATLRRARGWTQFELAAALGLANHAHVSNLEAGRKAPSLKLALAAARVFARPLDQLVRDDVPLLPPSCAPRVRALHEPAVKYACEPGAAALSARVAANVRALRARAGLTQTDVARATGLASHTFLSQLEAGHKAPSLALALRLADYFGVSLVELLGLADG